MQVQNYSHHQIAAIVLYVANNSTASQLKCLAEVIVIVEQTSCVLSQPLNLAC